MTKNTIQADYGKPISIFAFDPDFSMETFATDCCKWGVNEAILHPGFFKDGTTEKALARHKLSLWLNLPVFNNPEFLTIKPDYYAITSEGRRAIDDWCHFVCPSRRDYIDKQIEQNSALVKDLEPPRLSLDFIRFFVFWERVNIDGYYSDIEDGCYCQNCKNAFVKYSGLALPAKHSSTFIRNRAATEWAKWKAALISGVVDDYAGALRAASPHSEIWINTLPWKQHDLDGAIVTAAGQDVETLSSMVDGFAPMLLTHMLRQSPQWKSVF